MKGWKYNPSILHCPLIVTICLIFKAYLSKNTEEVEIESWTVREENHQHQHEADEHWAVGKGKLEHLVGDRSGKKSYHWVSEEIFKTSFTWRTGCICQTLAPSQSWPAVQAMWRKWRCWRRSTATDRQSTLFPSIMVHRKERRAETWVWSSHCSG